MDPPKGPRRPQQKPSNPALNRSTKTPTTILASLSDRDKIAVLTQSFPGLELSAINLALQKCHGKVVLAIDLLLDRVFRTGKKNQDIPQRQQQSPPHQLQNRIKPLPEKTESEPPPRTAVTRRPATSVLAFSAPLRRPYFRFPSTTAFRSTATTAGRTRGGDHPFRRKPSSFDTPCVYRPRPRSPRYNPSHRPPARPRHCPSPHPHPHRRLHPTPRPHIIHHSTPHPHRPPPPPSSSSFSTNHHYHAATVEEDADDSEDGDDNLDTEGDDDASKDDDDDKQRASIRKKAVSFKEPPVDKCA